MPLVSLNVNGHAHKVDADVDTPLLWVIRDEIGLTGTKFGCGVAQCGACTVHVDGQPVRSCSLPLSAVGDGKITTLAGLGTPKKPHPLQTAFIAHQVPQCGYCTSGIIMGAAALLAAKPKPTETEVRAALDGNLCRCGSHVRVLAAVMAASGQGG